MRLLSLTWQQEIMSCPRWWIVPRPQSYICSLKPYWPHERLSGSFLSNPFPLIYVVWKWIRPGCPRYHHLTRTVSGSSSHRRSLQIGAQCAETVCETRLYEIRRNFGHPLSESADWQLLWCHLFSAGQGQVSWVSRSLHLRPSLSSSLPVFTSCLSWLPQILPLLCVLSYRRCPSLPLNRFCNEQNAANETRAIWIYFPEIWRNWELMAKIMFLLALRLCLNL